MSTPHGKFVWYELMTTDAKAAETFYRDVVGWTAKDAGMPGMAYTLFSAGETQVAGLMALPEDAADAGARSAWTGYVAVDDVDKRAKEVARAGGTVHRQPADIPGIGRFAIVADPQGATFALFRGGDEGQPQSAPMTTPGHTGWHELYARDWQTVFAFYANLFGWAKGDAMDMGATGVYQIFAQGGEPVGGMMNAPKELPAPSWHYYFNVNAIDATKARIEKRGGQIINGPMEVPGGQWIVQGFDPQGAMFALVAPRR